MMKRYLITIIAATMFAATLVAAQPAADWRDTGVDATGRTCIDGAVPDTLLRVDGGVTLYQGRTVATNWRTGAAHTITTPFNYCADDGSLVNWRPKTNDATLFSSIPDATMMTVYAPLPPALASDGVRRMYSFDSDGLTVVNADGTTTSTPLPVVLGALSLVVTPIDGRALYLLAVDITDRVPRNTANYTITIFFSADAGATWSQKFSGSAQGSASGPPYVELNALDGAEQPAGTMQLIIAQGIPGSSNTTRVLLSTDAAASFRDVGTRGLGSSTYLYGTRDGVVRFTRVDYGYALELTRDDGASWEPLALPPGPSSTLYGITPQLTVARAAPATLALADGNGTWISADNGRSWQQVATTPRNELRFTPYLPLTLTGTQNGTLHTLAIADPGTALTTARPPLHAAGFAPETGQTIAPAFLPYWQANGGLAQFGYPRTAAFREVSATDRRVYLVQYFERNRFEYHPELAGTQYEVLLGLLGVQAAQGRANAAPFMAKPDPQQPGEIYFAATGHSVRNSFLRAWRTGGGLALYGYPISDEFVERNPEDGREYVVQYFERNRFEYHPEQAGTPYEVLFGLLGNDLLRQKGWLGAP